MAVENQTAGDIEILEWENPSAPPPPVAPVGKTRVVRDPVTGCLLISISTSPYFFLTCGEILFPVDTIVAASPSRLVEIPTDVGPGIPDGSIIWVRSVEDLFVLNRTSALTANNITIVDPLVGTGQWIRKEIPSGRWQGQGVWHVNPLIGDDENVGDTALVPLATLAEFRRRVSGFGKGRLIVDTVLNIDEDIPADDPFDLFTVLSATSILRVRGTPKTPLLGPVAITAVTNLVSGTNRETITAAGIVPFIGRRVRVTTSVSGVPVGTIAWIMRGTGNADEVELSTPYFADTTTFNFGINQTPQVLGVGDEIIVEELPGIATVNIEYDDDNTPTGGEETCKLLIENVRLDSATPPLPAFFLMGTDDVGRFDVLNLTLPPDSVRGLDISTQEFGGAGHCVGVDEEGLRGQKGLVYVGSNVEVNGPTTFLWIVDPTSRKTSRGADFSFRSYPLLLSRTGNYNPFEIIFDDEGFLWLASFRAGAAVQSEAVLKVDPLITNAVDAVVARGTAAGTIGVDSRGILFSADRSDSIFQLDLFNNVVQRWRKSDAAHLETSTGAALLSPWGMLQVGTDIWISGGSGRLWQMDINTMVIAAHSTVPGAGDFRGIGYDSKRNRLWVNDFFNQDMYVVDPSAPAGAPIAVIAMPARGNWSPRYDPELDQVYVGLSTNPGSMLIFDPNTNTIKANITAGPGELTTTTTGAGGQVSFSGAVTVPAPVPLIQPSTYDGLVLDLDPEDLSTLTLNGSDVVDWGSKTGSILFATDSIIRPQLVLDDPLFNGRNSVAFTRANSTHMTTDGVAGGSGDTLASLLRSIAGVSQFTYMLVFSLSSLPVGSDATDPRNNDGLFGALTGGAGILFASVLSAGTGQFQAYHGSNASDFVLRIPDNAATVNKQRGVWCRKEVQYEQATSQIILAGRFENFNEASTDTGEGVTPGQGSFLELGRVGASLFADFKLARLLVWDLSHGYQAVVQMIEKYLEDDTVFTENWDGS